MGSLSRGWFVFWSLWCLVFVVFGANGAALVPAVYVFGDSLVDVGNNNYIPWSVLKGNYPHYGVDYPGHQPTGRYTNGKNAADFIAEKVGLPSSPPYLSLRPNARNYMSGISFASGGAGISNSTNRGQCITFDMQIQYYSNVHTYISKRLGSSQAHARVSKSIFVLVIGSNDVLSYLRSINISHTPQQQFVDGLVSRFKEQLKTLYNFGARKFMVVGMGPIGCCPAVRDTDEPHACNATANQLSTDFNNGLKSTLEEIATEFVDFKYSLLDTRIIVEDYIQNATKYGFVEVKSACCGLGDLNAKVSCLPIATYCPNRRNHLFWDFVHQSEITHRMLIDVAYDGSQPRVFPINLRKLVAL